MSKQIYIHRIDKSLPLPEYKTDGSAGFDLYAREDTTIQSKEIGCIPSNVIIETPKDHVLIIASRSSTPKKKGLTPPHGIGVIDSDYRGPNDEIWIQVYNYTDKEVIIKRGERIAQGLLIPISRAEFIESEVNTNQSRGGFGSTDYQY